MVAALALLCAPAHAQTPRATSLPNIPTLVSIYASQPFASMNGHVQLLGGNHPLKSTPDNGDHHSGVINGLTLRFGKVADPLDKTRQVLYGAIKNSDPQTYFHSRVEIVPGGAPLAKSGRTYWIAAEIYVPAARYKAGAGNILQVHNSTPLSSVFGPFALIFTPAGYATPKAAVSVISVVSSQPVPKLPGFNERTTYHWFSDNPGFQNSTMGAYPVDTWVKWVFRYRGDPTGNSGLLHAWMNGVQVVNATGISIGTAPHGFPTDYLKVGVDDWQRSAGGAEGIWQMLRSVHVLEDNGYSVEQVSALLK